MLFLSVAQSSELLTYQNVYKIGRKISDHSLTIFRTEGIQNKLKKSVRDWPTRAPIVRMCKIPRGYATLQLKRTENAATGLEH